MIDEAGQLGLATAALVIRFLSDRGKLVLAGDHQQLAPILGISYPELEGPEWDGSEWEETLPLFGSILDALMSGRRELRQTPLGTGRNCADSTDSQETEESDGTVVQLLENWRCARCPLYTLRLTIAVQTKRGPGRICGTHLPQTIPAYEISHWSYRETAEVAA